MTATKRKQTAEAELFERMHHAHEALFERMRERSRATGTRYIQRHGHIGWDRLVSRIEEEYVHKGYSRAAARKWAEETAGKVWHEQHR